MTHGLTIWTYDWVPPGPRGFVRDLRLRWAAEEAGLPYQVRTVPFEGRETNHLDRQPFGQVPYLTDGEVEIFESGAGVLHLARQSEALMPCDPVGEAETLQWVIAALNSVEIVTLPWWFLKLSGDADNGLSGWLDRRLAHMERVLSERDWLAGGRFTVADLLMADVLRISDIRARGHRPATEGYVKRITSRSALLKAKAEQVAQFALADAEPRPKAACKLSEDPKLAVDWFRRSSRFPTLVQANYCRCGQRWSRSLCHALARVSAVQGFRHEFAAHAQADWVD